jgi:hypothetical protein
MSDIPPTTTKANQATRSPRTWLARVGNLIVLSVIGTMLGLWIIPRALDGWRFWNDQAYTRKQERHLLGLDNPPSPESFFPQEALSRPPIVSNFLILSATEAATRVRDTELVIGVEIHGEARAYPLNCMNGPFREVFNDTLGGTPIAATWCDQCHTAIVFHRVASGRTLTLGVSGLLWEGNLVMFDRETETLWSQMMGEAMRGPLVGAHLEIVPALVMDWKSWTSHHPNTTLMYMDRTADAYQTAFIHRDSGLVLGYDENGNSRVWDFASLYDRQVVNDLAGDRAVLATLHVATGTAALYDRVVDGELLEFDLRGGRLVDRGTGSEWEMLTGRALAGPLQGKRLAMLPAYLSDAAIWQAYHPRTTRWQGTGP